jgi:hypothetical protein
MLDPVLMPLGCFFFFTLTARLKEASHLAVLLASALKGFCVDTSTKRLVDFRTEVGQICNSVATLYRL